MTRIVCVAYNLNMKRVLSTLIITALLAATATLTKNIWESYAKLKVLGGDQKKVSLLEEKNEGLKKELSFRKSDFFSEKQARDKLGYGKKNEVAYVVQDEKDKNGESVDNKPRSNWELWVRLFRD